MCGIAGIVGPGAVEHINVVELMLSVMKHRGPDGKGLYTAPSGLCVLGHRRLAVIDLTEAASQPMVSEDNRFAFVYNGELYNFIEVKKELEARGEHFKSTGDTEVLLRLLMELGEDAIPRLNGMFAFGLWDENEKRLLVARDRFGQKPLYMTRAGNLWMFASEIRALLATGLIPRQLDSQGFLSFLSYGSVQGPSTIVKGISLVPRASSIMTKSNGEQNRRTYWTPPLEKRPYHPEELRTTFEAAVKRHLVSDAPIGLFLSGGIDSSAMARAASQISKKRVVTLTVVFPDNPDVSEMRYARRIADVAQTEHHEVPLSGEDVLHSLPETLEAMDQPTIDGVNTYLISLAARRAGLKSVLTGLGGDELFGGYPSFSDIPKIFRFRHLTGLVKGLSPKWFELMSDFSKKKGKVADFLGSTNDLVGTYLVRRHLFSSGQIRRLTTRVTADRWISGLSEERLRLLSDLTRGRALPDAIGLLEMDLYMGETLLRDSDVMGMAHGLEIRLPFLDADFVDYSLTLEPEVRVPKPFPKHLFVRAVKDWLPEENITRSKQGFTLPFHEWMLHELKGAVWEGLESLVSLNTVFDKKVIRTLWETFSRNPDRIGWARPWSLFVLGRYLATHRLEV